MTGTEIVCGMISRCDDLALVVGALHRSEHAHYFIGGLAVNHYLEPVVMFDEDFAFAASTGVQEVLEPADFNAESQRRSHPCGASRHPFASSNCGKPPIADFPSRAAHAEFLRVRLHVAAVSDVAKEQSVASIG